MFKAKCYPRETKVYMDNIRASVTNSMSGCKVNLCEESFFFIYSSEIYVSLSPSFRCLYSVTFPVVVILFMRKQELHKQ